MKNLSCATLTFTILFLTLTGCKEGLLEEIMNRKGIAKKIMVQEVIHDGRHYEFVYDKKGRVDYIDASQDGAHMYRYEVTYKNNLLYSAALIENGEVVSENHDFKYDKRKNIIEYTYSWYTIDVPGGVHSVKNFAYDNMDRLISVKENGGETTFEYDHADNVIQSTTQRSETTYTYDNKLNPLHLVPDLFAIVVEETFFWEFIFSGHNSETRHKLILHNMELQNTTYMNEYDPYFRLVSKTDQVGNGFTFIYE